MDPIYRLPHVSRMEHGWLQQQASVADAELSRLHGKGASAPSSLSETVAAWEQLTGGWTAEAIKRAQRTSIQPVAMSP